MMIRTAAHPITQLKVLNDRAIVTQGVGISNEMGFFNMLAIG